MSAGASHFSRVIREQSYDPSNPEPAISEAAHWAEGILSELKRNLDSTYPWRA